LIPRNPRTMSAMAWSFVVRVSMVPGVTDTDENTAALAKTVCGLAGRGVLGLLSYNQAAGANYRAAGMEFKPDCDETREERVSLAPFERCQVAARVA